MSRRSPPTAGAGKRSSYVEEMARKTWMKKKGASLATTEDLRIWVSCLETALGGSMGSD